MYIKVAKHVTNPFNIQYSCTYVVFDLQRVIYDTICYKQTP